MTISTNYLSLKIPPRDIETPFLRDLDNIEILNKAKKIFKYAIAYWIAMLAYSFVNYGIAKMLGLYTFTHGTGPLSYLGIQCRGAKVHFGGTSLGASQGLCCMPGENTFNASQRFKRNSKNFFHVFEDPFLLAEKNFIHSLPEKIKFYAQGSICISIATRVFSILSTAGIFTSLKPLRLPFLHSLFFLPLFMVSLTGILVPKLTFHYSESEIEKLKQLQIATVDPDFRTDAKCLQALRISSDIPPHRIGITGALLHGINQNTPMRMMSRPLSVIYGTFMVGVGIGMGTFSYSSFCELVSTTEN